MLFMVYLEDIENNEPIRRRLLDEHMQHIGAHLADIRLAGPLLRADGETPAGGILLMEAASEAALRAVIEADPYFKAGLWHTVRIHAFREIINAWKNDA